MLTSLELFAEQLGGKTITGVAKLLICERGEVNSNISRLQIDGVVITENNLPELDGHYAMMECEIIIVPRKLHSGAQGTLSPGYRVDQFLTSGYHNEENWKNHEELTIQPKQKRKKKS